jgi:hypothetical protein
MLSKLIGFLERGSASNGVGQNEALTGAHVLIPHGATERSRLEIAQEQYCRTHIPVLFLASSIQNIEQADFGVDGNLLAVPGEGLVRFVDTN